MRKRSNGESCDTCDSKARCPVKTGKPLEVRRGKASRKIGPKDARAQAEERGWCDAWGPCHDEGWT